MCFTLGKLTNEMNTNPTSSPPEDQKFSEDKNSSVLSDYTSFIPMKRRSSSPCDAHTDSKSKLRLSESPVMTNYDECPSETENQRQSTNCSVYSMEVDGDSCNRIDLNENRSLKVILTKLETSSTTYRLSDGEDNPNVQLDDDPSISNEQNNQSLSFMHYMWSGCADQKNNPLPHYVSYASAALVGIPESYFYNDGVFCMEEDISSPVKFGLTVAPIHETNTLCRVCTDIICVLLNQSFILDIDLDTFSTQNPFSTKFTEEQFEIIDRLYTPPPPLTLCLSPKDLEDPAVILAHGMSCAHVLNAARKRQLARLSQWVSCWERGETPSSENFLLFPCELVDFARLILSLTDQNFGPMVLQAVRKTLDCAKKQIALNKNPPLISLASDDKAIQDALSKLHFVN
ncbi:unnamed protein product [Trichobilharzia regenti]|nr:unnamed protein product [Trichobilharzia regenti]